MLGDITFFMKNTDVISQKCCGFGFKFNYFDLLPLLKNLGNILKVFDVFVFKV